MKTKFTFSKITKLLTSTILCFTFLSMTLELKAADPPVAKIMKTDAAPAIDGNANDPMWENAQVYSLDSVAKGEPKNSSATWKALWDDDYIYILVEVEDDVLGYSEDIKEWNRDAVEVFFDLGNTDDTGEPIGVKQYDVGDWQFRYNLVDKSITVGRGEDGVATDSKDGNHVETGTNYVVELKFKWSELKSSLDFTPAKDAELGIEVAVMDNDGTTDSDFQGALSWYANENKAHETSTYFGTATLDVPLVIPARTAEIVKTAAAPAIDGNANDPMWENANEYSIETVSKDEPKNNTATWKALWDEEYIYVLVEVEDDILNYSADLKEWERDAVEVFFDLGNTDDTGEPIGVKQYDVGDWQFRYNLVDNSISVGRGEEGVATDSKDGMHTENGTNYTVELKFAWAELKSSLDFTAAPNAEIGIEVAVMDNDGEPQGALSWNADANEAHKTSTYFGTATLVEPLSIPARTAEIVKTTAAPAIDGNANDPMWENANEYSIETVSKDEPKNNTATWKALWDEEYIYVLVEVEDDILNYSADLKEWERDAVEVFFDLGNTDDTGEPIGVKQYDVGDWQFRYNLVDNSISVGRGEEGVATDSKDGMHTENGTNYTVELKFAWAELKSSLDFTAAANAEIGFEVAVMDNDGEPQGALSWNADANEAHKTSTYFGTATLVLTTGINEIRANTVNIYPNPVANVLNIDNAAPNQVVSIYNITGQMVKAIEIVNSTDQIDIAGLEQGVYMIQVTDQSGNVNTSKFIKK